MTISFEKSKALYEVGNAVLAGGVSSNFRYGGYGESPVPLYYAKGEGSRLTDVDGNEKNKDLSYLHNVLLDYTLLDSYNYKLI